MTTEFAPLPMLAKPLNVDHLETTCADVWLLTPDALPDVSHLVTEDDEPVDNIFSEKQQRLLTEPLMTSWAGPGSDRPFVAFANVGLFYAISQPPLVPDVMVSLDVTLPEDIWSISHRSYMLWEFGKPPDVVIEIVSNQKGGEDGAKLRKYAHMRVLYYVIFDPQNHLGQGVLRVYELHGGIYDALPATWMPQIGLGVTLWQGEFENRVDTWLRWCDEHSILVPTGKERADQEQKEKERALLQIEQERKEKERALLQIEQERQEKEQALLQIEQERQEKEHALQEKNNLARTTARNLLPLLTDEQISQATGVPIDEVRSMRGL